MDIKVEDIMTSPAITIDMDAAIDKVQPLLKKHHINALPVINENREAVGIVSTSDILEDIISTDPVAAIMGEKVYTITSDDNVSAAAALMRSHKIHHLIVTENKKVVGILSTFDLLKLVENGEN